MKEFYPSDGKIFRHLQTATGLTDATQFHVIVKERNVVVNSNNITKFIPKWQLSNFAVRKLFSISKKDYAYEGKRKQFTQ